MLFYPVVFYSFKTDHLHMVDGVSVRGKKVPELVLFGEAVRKRRKDLGYSQEAFGDACGIDRSYIGGIERGEHNLALINILKIIATLEIQPSEFFQALDRPRKKLRSS
ncbi:DNA-binding XRE family transcriptional regulator [Variovorax paradoxus]|uniref:helix-turn-helix domain-containing protein n=1 Tax=Variovorax paradoxus TaxID=34073 RepID=UPI002783FAF8|nr:helix-turn-helix transcriptional regulator [Variovorax paradoxus]MDQ0027236.1 DNA-binding XRE family transcriptional regulator [Variovorax paradoxus]